MHEIFKKKGKKMFKKGKKGQDIRKLGQKYTNFDNILKKGRKKALEKVLNNSLNSCCLQLPSKSSDDQIITQMNLNNQALTLILWDFNSNSNFWSDCDNSTKECIDLESVSSTHGLHCLLTDLTDVIFLSQGLNLYWPS